MSETAGAMLNELGRSFPGSTSFPAQTVAPKRFDLERELVANHGVDAMYLGACSASTTYSEARARGLITDEQYDAARRTYGGMWNYCGD